MGGRQRDVEEHVEHAEQTVEQVQEHAEEVRERVAPPPVESEEERVEHSVHEAEESREELGSFAQQIRRMIEADPEIIERMADAFAAQRFQRRTAELQEQRFDRAAEGRTVTEVYESEGQVTAEVEVSIQEHEEHAIKQEQQRYEEEQKSESGWDRFVSWLRNVGRAIKRFFNAIKRALSSFFGHIDIGNAIAASRARELNEEVRRWLTPEYLGQRTHERFSEHPPVMSIHELPEAGGWYLPGSNGIAVDAAGIYSRGVGSISRADMAETILHEQLHYAAYLGGGREVRWRDEEGNPVFDDGESLDWFQEGLTELHAQQFVRERGMEPSGVAYAPETTIGFYLQQIAGEETLREAYLTGDFTEVRRAVNERLGEGTFEALLSAENGPEALAFLIKRLDEGGIDRTAWDSNPIVAEAGVVG